MKDAVMPIEVGAFGGFTPKDGSKLACLRTGELGSGGSTDERSLSRMPSELRIVGCGRRGQGKERADGQTSHCLFVGGTLSMPQDSAFTLLG